VGNTVTVPGVRSRLGCWLAAVVLAGVAVRSTAAEVPSYADVFSRYQPADYLTDADVAVRVEAETIARQGGGRAVVEDIDGARTVSWEQAGHWIEWTFRVPKRGLYTLEARYRIPEVLATDAWYIARAISIDGKLPFRELQDFTFLDAWGFNREERAWRIKSFNEYGEKPDVALRETEQVNGWQTALLLDRETASVEPYLFLLEAGAHTLRMEALNRPGMDVDAFTVRSYRPLAPYAAVAAEYQRKGYTPTSGVTVKIQAEDYRYQERIGALGIGTFVSAGALFMRSSGEPVGDYNTLGTWKRYNHGITWSFEVPETGLYQMVIRYTQDQDSLMRREIRIDGRVPFRELSPWVMKGTGGRNNLPPTLLLSDASMIQGEGTYDVVKWKQGVVGRDVTLDAKHTTVEPYLFYLEKGSHVLQVRPVLGPERVKIRRDLDTVRTAVSGAFQQVKELLGQYASLEEAVKAGLDLKSSLPDLSVVYRKAAADLDVIMSEIMSITPPGYESQATPTISVLKIIREELLSVARDPDIFLAPEQFDSGFTTGESSSASMMDSSGAGITTSTQGNFEARVINVLSNTTGLYDNQPVEMDWIAFASPDVNLPEPASPWFFTLQWLWKEFLRSFKE
jgi:hypothetical protein